MATVTSQKKSGARKKSHAGLIVFLVVVILAAAAAALWYFRPRPLVTAEAYIAAPRETAEIRDETGSVIAARVRGQSVTYVVEDEDPDRPGMVRLDWGEDGFAWIAKENLTDDLSEVVTLDTVYVRTPINLTDRSGAEVGALAEKGQALEVTGYDGLGQDGSVARYRVRLGEEEGYVRAGYLTYGQDEALAQYDEEHYALHVSRGDQWGGGNAAELDYYPREKEPIEGNPMPDEVKALYLNSGFVPDVDRYLEVAADTGINAFVVDIQDGGAVSYGADAMQKYCPTAYESATNTMEEYRAAVQKIRDAGYYTIGRMTTFNDPYFAVDHPEAVIADAGGAPLKIGGMYWPSAYNRYTWQYKVDLAVEAVEQMGFNEIQFDYVRFPDGTWRYEDSGGIDYRNQYGENKAQAVQRFLMYACDRIHDAGAYVGADVFGECAEEYVCAYGQYWPAISNVVDVISAMPYPDHYAANGSWLPWEHPYDVLSMFGKKAAARQEEILSPAVVRTWIQAYSAIREPYPHYGPDEISAQIRALRDTGHTGGYMTWNAASSIEKYWELRPALQ